MTVLYDVADRVATLTLNRPDKRNALDDATIAQLKVRFAEADADHAVRVVVLRGAGKDFCAGGDLSQLEKIVAHASREENLADAMNLGELFIQMRRARKPSIAAVRGHALAGGAGLASACDLIIAEQGATFGYPEVKLGFVPAMVMALLRRSLGEKRAFELVARGERITAKHALDLGLVNHVYPRSSFEEETHAYLRGFAARSASAIRLTKRLLYGMDGLSFEEAIARGAEVNVLARNTEDCRQGVRDFLARRKP